MSHAVVRKDFQNSSGVRTAAVARSDTPLGHLFGHDRGVRLGYVPADLLECRADDGPGGGFGHECAAVGGCGDVALITASQIVGATDFKVTVQT